MASTMRSGDSTAAGAAPDAAGREKADAAKLLGLVFGAEVLAAIHEGFLKDGDYRTVVPLLGARGVAVATDPATGHTSARQEKEAAAQLLGRVFGARILAAIHEGFLKDGDYRGVLPLLGAPAIANAHVCAATQAAFEKGCAAGEAGVAGLCLAHAGVDGGAHVGGDGTVLGAAAGRGDDGMVRALAASGKVDVNQAATARGSSALMLASYDGHGECVVALLAVDGIDANHANTAGSTALTLASQNGHAEVVRALLAADGIDANHANDRGYTALAVAAQNGHAEVVRALLAVDGIDANHADDRSSTALAVAAQNGHAEVVRALLAVDVIDANHADVTGNTALVMASNNGHAEIVRALLAVDGIDAHHANDGGSTALVVASQEGHVEVVRALLAVDGIDANHTNNDGNTALFLASQNGHAGTVRALLAVDGIDANHANNKGDTALIYASQDGHVEVVRALLAVDGIDANYADDGGATALIMASQEGHADVVRALLAVDGIDANLTATDDDCTSLMLAVLEGHASCVHALVVAKGIDVNLKSPHFGNATALHDACRDMSGAARVEMVKLLLTAGGCRFQLDDAGQTPLDLAADDKGVIKVFASGVDYWQRTRHGSHGWAMKEAVKTVLLVRQHHGALALAPACAPASLSPDLPEEIWLRMPEEIWLAVCCFLRSADFMP